jgi:hypothetical protein
MKKLENNCPHHPGAPWRQIDGGKNHRCSPTNGVKCKYTR